MDVESGYAIYRFANYILSDPKTSHSVIVAVVVSSLKSFRSIVKICMEYKIGVNCDEKWIA